MNLGRAARGLCRFRDKHDLVAQAVQALDQPGSGALARDLVETEMLRFCLKHPQPAPAT
jgi:hypothetical protein